MQTKLPKLRRLAAALLITLAAMPADSQAITKTEFRHDPPAITDRRLRDMIWEMFRQEDHRTREAPQAFLGDLWLETKVRGTRVSNLCRHETVRIEMAPIMPGPRDADTPVRPVGINTLSPSFRFLKPPPLGDDAPDHDARVLTGGPCTALDPRKQNFFAADDEYVARDAMIAFLKLQQALREKRNVKLQCDLSPVDKGSCADIILALDPALISYVDTCQPRADHGCFVVDNDLRALRISLDGSENAKGNVTEVRLDPDIVIAEGRRID
jgi:hypothetical protein